MKKSLLTGVLLAALSLGLAGCAGAPQSPAQAVFQAKTSYSTALTAAVAYKRLPVCREPAVQPCSDPKIVAQLQKADNVAAGALDAAEAAVRTPGFGSNVLTTAAAAASSALQAFLAVTATLGAK